MVRLIKESLWHEFKPREHLPGEECYMCARYTYSPGEFHDLRLPLNLALDIAQLKQRFNIAGRHYLFE